MDYESYYYLLLGIALMLLLLGMWVCAASSVQKWGPDLTLDLPPHVLQEALFGKKTITITELTSGRWTRPFSFPKHTLSLTPSAPSEYPSAPLLSNEESLGTSSKISKPPVKSFSPSVILSMDKAIRVLPPLPTIRHNLTFKPVYYKFSTEESAKK